MGKTSITGALISLDIERQSEKPLHRQIAGRLRDAIASGQLPSGLRLPSTRVLAKEIGVSRNTVLQVFEALAEEGLLTGKVGAGTFVAALQPKLDVDAASHVLADRDDGYPFRSLSRRGRSLLASSNEAFSEHPAPFMPDLPDLRAFPMRTWLRLLHEISGRLIGKNLAVASSAGYEPLRRAIALSLNASRGMACDYAQVIVTTGSQQSLDLVCRLLIDPGDPVWIEEPGYIGAQAVIKANGAVIHPVAVDRDGFCVDDALATKPAPRLVYVSPSRQYPLGATLSMERRKALLDLAKSSGAFIVEDDYDQEFRYANAPLPAIFGLDGASRTFYIGTFSKSLLPSFRLGFVVVPPDFAAAFAKARAVVDRHASLIEQMVLSEFMERGLFAAHVRRMRVLYRKRQQMLVAGLRALLGADIAVSATDTGMHIILPLKPGADDVALACELAARGVVSRPLSPYYTGQDKARGLLFGFAAFSPEEISKGMTRLSSADVGLSAVVERVAF